MAVIDITFACDCGPQAVDIDKMPSPTCLSCGNARIVRHTAPAPRFRGCVTGPYAQTVDLPAVAVRLTAPEGAE